MAVSSPATAAIMGAATGWNPVGHAPLDHLTGAPAVIVDKPPGTGRRVDEMLAGAGNARPDWTKLRRRPDRLRPQGNRRPAGRAGRPPEGATGPTERRNCRPIRSTNRATCGSGNLGSCVCGNILMIGRFATSKPFRNGVYVDLPMASGEQRKATEAAPDLSVFHHTDSAVEHATGRPAGIYITRGSNAGEQQPNLDRDGRIVDNLRNLLQRPTSQAQMFKGMGFH